MPPSNPLYQYADDFAMFWHFIDVQHVHFVSFLDDPGVRIYFGLGLAAVNGKLLRINKADVRDGCGETEMQLRLRRATGFAIRRLYPSVPECLDPQMPRGVTCGSYVLFFGSAYQGRTPVFCNNLKVHKWMPGLRTCEQMLGRLQRRYRKKLGDRMALVFATALHARLGKDAGVACLGPDLLGYVCRFL